MSDPVERCLFPANTIATPVTKSLLPAHSVAPNFANVASRLHQPTKASSAHAHSALEQRINIVAKKDNAQKAAVPVRRPVTNSVTTVRVEINKKPTDGETDKKCMRSMTPKAGAKPSRFGESPKANNNNNTMTVDLPTPPRVEVFHNEQTDVTEVLVTLFPDAHSATRPALVQSAVKSAMKSGVRFTTDDISARQSAAPAEEVRASGRQSRASAVRVIEAPVEETRASGRQSRASVKPIAWEIESARKFEAPVEETRASGRQFRASTKPIEFEAPIRLSRASTKRWLIARTQRSRRE